MVISIIALLIAILLPTLNAARQVAQSATCLSIHRQLAMANELYAIDSDETYVPLRGENGLVPSPAFNIWNLSSLYLEKLNARGAAPTSTARRWSRDFICPAAELALENPNNAGGYNPQFAFGYNYYGKGFGDPSDPTNPVPVFEVGEIKNPSRKLSFADSLSWSLNPTSGNPDQASNYEGREEINNSMGNRVSVAYRHFGSANVAFFDGHASTTPREEVDPAFLTIDERDRLWNLLED